MEMKQADQDKIIELVNQIAQSTSEDPLTDLLNFVDDLIYEAYDRGWDHGISATYDSAWHATTTEE